MTSIKDLKADHRNARKRTDRSANLIAESLKRFGAARSIVIDEDNRILAGNGTVEGAKAAGIQNIRVIETDGTEIIAVKRTGLSEDDKIGLALADNRTSDLSDWDKDMLQQLSAEHDLAPWFEADDLAEIIGEAEQLPTEGLTDADDVPEPPEEPITKPGDVWLLGNHRVMCGDSTSVDSVEALMAGVKADCVWTDPPYGVAYVGGVSHDPKYAKKREAKGLTIENDALNDDELTDFLRASLGVAFAACKDGAAWYVAAPAGPLFHCFGTVLKDFGVWRHTLAWVKSAFVFGRSDYHYQHEAIFYGWKPGSAHKWTGDRKQSSTLNFDRPKGSENPGHPTPKPVELVEYCLGNSSGRGDVVLEPFGGSGSTLIACEKTGRHARLMELDPKYCDVIVKRWEQFTGNKAMLELISEAF